MTKGSVRPVVGIDPGMNETGLVLREGDTPRRAFLVTRAKEQVEADYLTEVVEAVRELVVEAGPEAVIAMERLTAPRGFDRDGERSPINPGSLIGTGLVMGALLITFPSIVLVDQGGHGSGPLFAYPASLVGAREKVGTGQFRHVRSAWDIAAAGLAQDRLNRLVA